MGRVPQKLREIIAANIRECRLKKFPGQGGSKKCALAFGVSPQQWSPWERARRTPDEMRLSQLADFFGVTVDHLRHSHVPKPPTAPAAKPDINPPSSPAPPPPFPAFPNEPPGLRPGVPSSAESFYWLLNRLVVAVTAEGLHIRIDGATLSSLCELPSRMRP